MTLTAPKLSASLLNPNTSIHFHLNSAYFSPLLPLSSVVSAFPMVESKWKHHPHLSTRHHHITNHLPHSPSISNSKSTPAQTVNFASSLSASPLSLDDSSSDANSVQVDTVVLDDAFFSHLNFLYKRMRDNGRLLKRNREIQDKFCVLKHGIQSTHKSVFVHTFLRILLRAAARFDEIIQNSLLSS